MVGSTDSDGNLQLKKELTNNGPNWTIIILFVLVFLGGYLIPSPLSSKLRTQVQETTRSEVLTTGVADTVYVRVPAIAGVDTRVDDVVYTDSIKVITIEAMPTYVENVVNINSQGLDGIIRATAYPYVENDSLKIDLPIEWNIKPKPMELITRVDTLRIVDSIFTVKDISLLEKPEIIVVGTSIVWLALLIILL